MLEARTANLERTDAISCRTARETGALLDVALMTKSGEDRLVESESCVDMRKIFDCTMLGRWGKIDKVENR